MINCSLLSWEGGNPLHHLKMCGVFHPVLGEDILGSLGTESLIYAVLGSRQWRTSDTIWYSFSWKGPSLETNLPFNYWTSGRSISCLTQATHRREFATMSAGDAWRLQLKEILLCKEDSCLHPQTFVLHSSNQYTPLLFWWVCCGSSGGWGTRTGLVQKLHRVTETCKKERLVLPLPLYVFILVVLRELTSARCRQARRGSDWPF